MTDSDSFSNSWQVSETKQIDNYLTGELLPVHNKHQFHSINSSKKIMKILFILPVQGGSGGHILLCRSL